MIFIPPSPHSVFKILGPCLVVLGLTGCTLFQQTPQGESLIDQVAFEGYIEDHTSCMNTENLSEIENIISRLENAPIPVSAEESSLPIPEFLVNLTSKPISRLAIDPKSLAASCTLHAGQVALKQGKPESAYQLFSSIVAKYHEPSYSYYVKQAHSSLRDIYTTPKSTTKSFSSTTPDYSPSPS